MFNVARHVKGRLSRQTVLRANDIPPAGPSVASDWAFCTSRNTGQDWQRNGRGKSTRSVDVGMPPPRWECDERSQREGGGGHVRWARSWI